MRRCRSLSFAVLSFFAAATSALAAPNGVVISGFQVRGPAGGNDEYVEIRNTSAANVDISGWKLQGCASGTPGNVSNRATVGNNIVLTAGQYYLFTNNNASGPYSGTVTGDATYATGFTDFAASNFAGIKLVDAADVHQDGVGSPQSPCREGTGLVTPTANGASNAFARSQDTDNNVADFAGPQATNPHNSGGIVETCDNDGVKIYDIQGAGHVSPMNTETVCNVPGIVSQVMGNGFFMQDGDGDGNVNTSDGIFVFTGGAPTVIAGQQVKVKGTVSEFRPGSSFGATNCPSSSGACNLTVTEITGPVVSPASGLFTNTLITPVVLGAGGRVPPNQVIDDDTAGSVEVAGQTTYDPAQDGIDFYESVAGMQVQVNNARVVGPTNDFGEIWLVGDNGVNATGANARGGLTLIQNGGLVDFNPERIQIDVSHLTASLPANVGDTTGQVTGAMTFDFGNFRILPATLPVFTSGGLTRGTSTVATGADRLRIATYNVENLDPNDADMCDGRPDQDIADGRFMREAQQIVGALGSPDILSLEEVQDNSGCTNDGVVDSALTLDTLIAAIVTAGGPTYSYAVVNPTNNADGGAPGGNIRQAILYNPARVTFVPGTVGPGDATTATVVSKDAAGKLQLSHSPGRIDPANGAWSNSRKPLVATFDFNGRRVLVITNHFNSKGGDEPLFGRFQPPELGSEVQRLQQAQVEHDFIAQALTLDANARIVTLGDFNDFEFSAPMRVLTGASVGAPILTDLSAALLPSQERYSYVFQGNSQELDHIFVTSALLPDAQFQVIHVNAEFADQVSDHDPMIASLKIATPDATAPVITVPAAFAVDATSPQGATVTFNVTATDNSGVAPPVTCTPASGTPFAIGNTTVLCTATDAAGNSASASFVVTVRGVPEQTARLIADVLALKGINVSPIVVNVLANTLKALLNSRNHNLFCAVLTNFVRDVSFLSGRLIPAVRAAALVAAANRIKAVEGC